MSIDPLGHLEVKAFLKSRKVVKAWPLLARCLDTGAVLCLLMESMETKSVVNSLLRLQLRVGRIEKICMDQRTNMIELKRLVDSLNGLLQLKEVKFQPVYLEIWKTIENLEII